MNKEKRDFDQEAAQWDDQPRRVKMTEEIFSAIKANAPLNTSMDVMDFGCGTGLVSFLISSSVKSVTGVDSSKGMLEVLNQKISKNHIQNIKTLFNEDFKTLTGKFDLIVSSMTLHHIENIPSILKKFFGLLKPNGYLCIADLDFEGGKFHTDNTGVFHFGFEKTDLEKDFRDVGFENVISTDAAQVTKPNIDGEMQTFSIFLIAGQKK